MNRAGTVSVLLVIVLIAGYFHICLKDSSTSTSGFGSEGGDAEANAVVDAAGSEKGISTEMNAFRAIFVTVPNIEVGKKIAHGLVSNKLAACVNIIPQVTSVYEWEGKINEDSELILMIKSQASLFGDVEKFVKDNHPYSVPEVIALPIEQGSEAYLNWIKENTK